MEALDYDSSFVYFVPQMLNLDFQRPTFPFPIVIYEKIDLLSTAFFTTRLGFPFITVAYMGAMREYIERPYWMCKKQFFLW